MQGEFLYTSNNLHRLLKTFQTHLMRHKKLL